MESARLRKCVLSSFSNIAGLTAARMSGDSGFHAAGPACEKARSPNLGPDFQKNLRKNLGKT